jgi:hypothetical protein
MNIVEQVKQILTDYSGISAFTNDMHVDFTDETPTNFGIYPNGDQLIKEDVLGNQTRRHSFVLYAKNQAANDFDRLVNSTFLLELNYFLETVQDIKVTAKVNEIEKEGIIKNMSSANGMMFDIPTGQVADGVTYQLQIYADYYLESED